MLKSDRRALRIALVAGAGVLGWLLALLANRGLARYLTLPEDASLVEVEISVGATDQAAPQPSATGEEPPADEDEPPLASSSGRRPLNKADWIEPILRRNIFDSSKVGQGPGDVSEVGDSDRRTDLRVTLLATAVTDPPEYSSAWIAEDKGPSAGYGVGDLLLGEATIVKIEQKKVYIRRSDGTVEYIGIDEQKKEEGSGGGRPKRAELESGGDDTSGVSQSGDNKYVVDRAVVDRALSDPEALAKQIRVAPHKDANGDVDGYRVSGIRRNSLFSKLGLKNSDVIHSVNGRPLTSTSSAIDAYTTLQNDSNFTFEISRRNNKQTMEYEVR